MPKASKFTEEQEAFLQKKIPAFRIAQGDVTVQTFAGQVYAEFFRLWPLPEGEDIKTIQKVRPSAR